jgi:hypothetical protein
MARTVGLRMAGYEAVPQETPFADWALAETEPLVAVSSTGWPHAALPLIVMKIAPSVCVPADTWACWQVAPVEVGWQLHPKPPPKKFWRLPSIDAPDGSVIATASWLVGAEPVLLT